MARARCGGRTGICAATGRFAVGVVQLPACHRHVQKTHGVGTAPAGIVPGPSGDRATLLRWPHGRLVATAESASHRTAAVLAATDIVRFDDPGQPTIKSSTSRGLSQYHDSAAHHNRQWRLSLLKDCSWRTSGSSSETCGGGRRC